MMREVEPCKIRSTLLRAVRGVQNSVCFHVFVGSTSSSSLFFSTAVVRDEIVYHIVYNLLFPRRPEDYKGVSYRKRCWATHIHKSTPYLSCRRTMFADLCVQYVVVLGVQLIPLMFPALQV